MSQLTENDKKMVYEIMKECSERIMALVEGQFMDEFEIELLVDGKKYLMTLKESDK